MATPATIAITPGAGQLLDAVSLTVGLNTVVRETMVIADPSNATYLATVTAGGALNVADAVIEACITANVLAVSLPTAQITTLTPPTAAAIGTAVSGDLLIGTQVAGSSVPVALPTATITTLIPPTAAAIASAIVSNPPTVPVTQSTSPWVISGTVTSSGSATVIGTLTHNNAAPAATEIGVLPALANVAAPTFTEGKQVLLSTDLAGNLRVSGTVTGTITGAVTGTLTNNNAAPSTNNFGVLNVLANAAAPSWNEGDLVTASSDLAGNTRVILHAETTKAIGTVNQGTSAANTAGWPVTAGSTAESTAAWTNATSGNTAVQVNCAGMTTAVVTLNQGSTLTGGVVTFEVSDTTAFTNAFPISGQIPNPSGVNLTGTFTFVANTNRAFIFNVSGWAAFRVRLSTVISGTGTVNVGVTLSSAPNSTATTTTAYITGAAITLSVMSPLNDLIVADNNTGNTAFGNTNGTVNPLATGSFVYGGAFSGAASSTKQGWSKSRTPTVFNTVQATASGNTAVWTPGSGNKFRLLKLFVQVTANASLASGGVLTISFQDSSTSINIAFDVFVPTTAVTTVIGDGLDQELDLGYFGVLSAAANNVMNVNLSSALATGNVRVITMGTEE